MTFSSCVAFRAVRAELGVAGMLALSFGGCTSRPLEESPTCVRAGIFGGSERSSYLALAEAQERAIVRLSFRVDGRAAACSGVIVAPGVALTAAHCVDERASAVTLQIGGERPESAGILIDPAQITRHPSLDLAQLRWDETDPFAVPIPVLGAAVDRGALVQVGGFGFDERGGVGALGFAVLQVAEVEEATFRVDAGGRAGACDGDSGGPALLRDAAGAVVVAGILSSGSASCAASDNYVALSELGDWLALSDETSSAIADCELLPESGRCFGSAVAYCAEGSARVEACSDGQSCGFDASVGGFRCLDPDADPCHGLGDRGICEGDVRLWCQDGELHRAACEACGASCVYSARDGRAICNAD